MKKKIFAKNDVKGREWLRQGGFCGEIVQMICAK